MKALTFTGDEKAPIVLTEKDKPEARAQEVLIKLSASALNHRDQWMRVGKYPGMKAGATLGSDGCGVVEAVGDGADPAWIGKAVVINPNINWGANPKVQSSDYHILGMPSDGTFAEYVTVNQDRIHEKPEHLSSEEAAALPLGGLTAFRACFTQGEISGDSSVLVTGIGGGVALFVLQYAIASGARVYVSSSSSEKIESAKGMGAIEGFDYTKENWVKEAQSSAGGFDVIIDSAGGDALNHYLRLIRPAGRIVFYGSTLGVPGNLDLFRIFWQQVRLQGTTMGSDQEFKEMLSFVAKHKIVPVVDSVRPFSKILSAMDEMESGNQMGKLVLKF